MPTANRGKNKGWLGTPLWASLAVHAAGLAALVLTFAAPLLLKPTTLIVEVSGPARSARPAAPPRPARRTPAEEPEEAPAPAESAQIEAPAESSPGIAPPAIHGAQVLYSPSPRLPEDLASQDLKATVLIEFVIRSDGSATASLAQTSGNRRLDEIALKTASQWRFGPAVGERGPIDSRLRLRINFEVE
jgi:TonB family protein